MKSKTNQIWLLLDSSKPGGIESHVFQLAKGLHNFKEKVSVIFLTDYGHHPLRDILVSQGIPTKTLNGKISALWNLMRKTRPSVLHTHGYKAGIFGRIVSRLCRVPVISTYHAGETSNGKLGLYQWLDEKSAGLASQIFAVSPQIASRLPSKTIVLDNFIDTNDIKYSKGKQIAFVGRLSREKGADYYLKLADRFPDLNFHIYGGGPESHDLEISAPINVLFHGQQNDMTNVWTNIGLLIMPSRNEGLPMAALEAIARGIPILASDVGAFNKLVYSNINGWITPSGDIDAMASHLRQWINMNEEQKHQFKMAAQAQIEQGFSATVAIPKLIAYYRQTAI